MSTGLEITSSGLRAHLDESDWAALAIGTGANLAAAELRPLPDTAASGAQHDDALIEAARLALGGGLVRLAAISGTGDTGALAQIGTDLHAAGIAIRALTPAPGGSGPVGVPGVEVGANTAGNVIAEVMRLFPAAGLKRSTGRGPITMSHDMSVTLVQALKDGKTSLANTIASQAGFDEPPEVMRSLANGTTASLTLTVRVAGQTTAAMRHWLLADVGWVQLAVRQHQVTHIVMQRDEIRDDLLLLLTGAYETAATFAELTRSDG